MGSPLTNLPSIFSTREHLQEISQSLQTFARLPISSTTIPGAVMEDILASVRGGSVLKTYDFVDVIDPTNAIGWQVKSTKQNTPVTWKRVKLPNSTAMIERSQKDKTSIQNLGNAIITFCNDHGRESLERYGLKSIGYARLIIHTNRTATYFERELITTEHPLIFNPNDFTWTWSKPKRTKAKEQLSALHGLHTPSDRKWFAWHGQGENQLHFSGESAWWPSRDDPRAITLTLPKASEKIDLRTLARLLKEFDNRPAR